MARWIDADKLKKTIARLHALNDEAEIRRAYAVNPHSTMTDFEETLVSVFDAIDEAPSIDIVKCGDCKYDHKCNHSVQRITSKPDHMSIVYVPIGWCERGERRE